MSSLVLAAAVALVLGGVVVVALPALLRALPRPADQSEPWSYASAGGPAFRWAAGGISAVASFAALGSSDPRWWLAWAALSAPGVVLAAIDARTGYLPRRLTWAAYAVAAAGVVVGCAVGGDAGAALAPAIGSVVGGGVLWGLWHLGFGLGFGDVRLAALIGLVAGTGDVTVAMWSLAAGGLIGAIQGAVRRLALKHRGAYPFGPALVAGAFAVAIVDAVVGTVS